MALLLRATAIAAVISLVWVGFTLLSAHLQVRASSVAPLPTTEELLDLKSADGPQSVRFLNTSEQGLAAGILTHSVFLLEWADGRLFMIDAGMSEGQAAEFGNLIRLLLRGTEPQVHGAVNALMGESIRRVAGVGFTHLHIDHTEGLNGFCARSASGVQLLQTAVQRDEHNFNTSEGAGIVASSCLQPRADTDSRVVTSARFPGIGLFSIGGHTPGSTLFAAWVGESLYLFSGDATNSKREIIEDKGKGTIYSYLLVPEDTSRTAELRAWLREMDGLPDTHVVVSHDLQDIGNQGIEAFR